MQFTSKEEIDETYAMVVHAMLAALVPDDTRTKDQRVLDYVAKHLAPNNIFDRDLFSITFEHRFKFQTTHRMMRNAKVSGAPFLYLKQAHSLKN
ncbi:hypothetical protein pEaSNUABM14_00283 [Erwinia phage pEa_SNUABM_14]|uniref:Uncharacterized protein n=1 Tax=Erwinia phage pEa_SNUABM_7 TaxID=2866695 RepID=A0AAE7WT64_9CAUD|nr:hypothetical protein MPK74_gp286 [Erwinia phage pEa_SNUABM_7]QYW03243.1 hypothetical protein pEaSNUABM13_00284 [Erwinia phage pEa_SNUABM_13]QYW03925.1 hypothetical protein pEaSNUABM45_00282 [Erwinia phage pEa_SNUABM_45]QYW04266.1 hypothetical protein pEaSNUABM46_00282 [Erwinia phage pEa_SNUABM_46]QYW04608.1 hypothetical protein pEaSNUABM14_00283 [Erwinia phage pEa_SNUABM_14]QYW04954.1 hypothetical protein pEaSNUABM7_00286 [Erwinia phage pEa_SNUABM_7]